MSEKQKRTRTAREKLRRAKETKRRPTQGLAKLLAWLETQSRYVVAQRLGIRREVFDRYCSGWRRPEPKIAAKIETVSGGAVPARLWQLEVEERN